MARAQSTECIRALLAADGIDPNLPASIDNDSDECEYTGCNTALHWVVFRSANVDSLRALVDADGIDVNQLNNDGATALDIVVTWEQ